MTTIYTSGACNRRPHSIDWGNNGLVCYAINNAIAIYSPQRQVILTTLHKHENKINVCRWIKSKKSLEYELISASTDGTAIVWTKRNKEFHCDLILNATDIITIVDAIYFPFDREQFDDLLICTGSTSGLIKLWTRQKDMEQCFQTLSFQRKLPMEARLSFLLDENIPLLAVALEDFSIELYCMESLFTFVKVQVLTGHQDWVRCMDFTNFPNNNSMLLASGSQDMTVRLWKFFREPEEKNNELKRKEQSFLVRNRQYKIVLESVLSGHEGWIFGVHWHKEELKLLSCSLDKSMIIWEPDMNSGMWIERLRVGEVGGNTLGFYGCKFSPNGNIILAHGFHGSFHSWEYSHENNWVPRRVPGGHFSAVVDLCWDPKGRFLMTCSTDQTTRIHAPWNVKYQQIWHEMGRPQVHGHDMACLTMLTPYEFVSGAEEKVLRVFKAPALFRNQLKKITNVDDFENTLMESASVPALGLTNKATFNVEENSIVDPDEGNYTPPTEEELIQNTLWPEVQKLYGHGYEIFSVAARHDGLLLASACKSTSLEHSAIILWNTQTWSLKQNLNSHQLTVTQMEFSPNNQFLVSVSRDRKWSLFQCCENDTYNLVSTSSKNGGIHSRIIWCCTWTHDSKFFATGSRDGKIGVWNINQNHKPDAFLNVQDLSVTALAFTPFEAFKSIYLLGIGYDDGTIEIQGLNTERKNFTWISYMKFDTSQAHHLTVRRLKFRPNVEEKLSNVQLASCGNDHMVKIFNLNIEELKFIAIHFNSSK